MGKYEMKEDYKVNMILTFKIKRGSTWEPELSVYAALAPHKYNVLSS
jgi:hypothetical protein